jgi:2-polyprenyl-3-methyl-5-hydroxy-6-metoxy-1,4-benzoquinol methylase
MSASVSPSATQAPPRQEAETTLGCRFCGTLLTDTFADLGKSPLANSYLTAADLNRAELFYPLHAYVCHECLLVQVEAVETPGHIFSDYAYFSSYSETLLEHARQYVDGVAERFALGSDSRVIEVASNDGYLLQYFVQRGIPVLGIEPAANVADVARERGIPTRVMFLTDETAATLAAEGHTADLVVANNVLAHTPELNGFVRALGVLLKREGVITVEFPHLLNLMEQNQFDTIYHEHYSYFSLLTVSRIFAAHGLVVFDVEEVATHGGSLRIYACHQQSGRATPSDRVVALAARERERQLDRCETYLQFQQRINAVKRDLLAFLIDARRGGKSVVAYGAPAKGNTLLNYCGIRTDLVDYTVDVSPHKQGRYLPGTQLPISAPARIRETRPDYVLILPWNLEREITKQMHFVREWGGQFVIPIPSLKII